MDMHSSSCVCCQVLQIRKVCQNCVLSKISLVLDRFILGFWNLISAARETLPRLDKFDFSQYNVLENCICNADPAFQFTSNLDNLRLKIKIGSNMMLNPTEWISEAKLMQLYHHVCESESDAYLASISPYSELRLAVEAHLQWICWMYVVLWEWCCVLMWHFEFSVLCSFWVGKLAMLE